jgi:hypothetical protein
MNSEQELRNLYLSFNARDIDSVLASTAQGVNWQTLGREDACMGKPRSVSTGSGNGPKSILMSSL